MGGATAGGTNSVDSSTGTVQTIEYEHHEIHAGSHYFYTDLVTLGAAATQQYMITTPNTTQEIHLLFVANGSFEIRIDLAEGADRNGAVVQTVYNNNRDSTRTANAVIHKGVAGGTTDGTVILTLQTGSATNPSKTADEIRQTDEIILKRNTNSAPD